MDTKNGNQPQKTESQFNRVIRMIELNKRVQKSLSRIERMGGVILIHHTREGSLDYQTPTGKGVSPSVVHKLRQAGYLVSGRDGHLAGCEQTLHVAAP